MKKLSKLLVMPVLILTLTFSTQLTHAAEVNPGDGCNYSSQEVAGHESSDVNIYYLAMENAFNVVCGAIYEIGYLKGQVGTDFGQLIWVKMK